MTKTATIALSALLGAAVAGAWFWWQRMGLVNERRVKVRLAELRRLLAAR